VTTAGGEHAERIGVRILGAAEAAKKMAGRYEFGRAALRALQSREWSDK